MLSYHSFFVIGWKTQIKCSFDSDAQCWTIPLITNQLLQTETERCPARLGPVQSSSVRFLMQGRLRNACGLGCGSSWSIMSSCLTTARLRVVSLTYFTLLFTLMKFCGLCRTRIAARSSSQVPLSVPVRFAGLRTGNTPRPWRSRPWRSCDQTILCRLTSRIILLLVIYIPGNPWISGRSHWGSSWLDVSTSEFTTSKP